MGSMSIHRGLYMKLKDMDALMAYSGAGLDFLLLLEEYLQSQSLSLDHLTEWITHNEDKEM